jgi:hypothetical protein
MGAGTPGHGCRPGAKILGQRGHRQRKFPRAPDQVFRRIHWCVAWHIIAAYANPSANLTGLTIAYNI